MVDVLKRGGERGFSLIEMMIALCVLTTGCVGVIGMFSAADQAVAGASRQGDATRLAREIIDAQRALVYEQLTDGAHDELLGAWSRRWEVRRDAPAVGLTTITVVIQWHDARHRPRQLELSTLRVDARAGSG